MDTDVEKADDHHRGGLEPSYTSSTSTGDDIPLEHVRTNRTGITSRSIRSTATDRQRRLDGTDPYENLENALEQPLTPDILTDDDDDDTQNAAAVAPTRTATSTASRPPDFEVIFDDNDPEDPRNWSILYRAWILFCVSYTCWVVTLYSTSYTSSTPGLMRDFGISQTTATLGMTTYLLGLAAGSLVLAPLSELFGRQAVYMACLTAWALLIIPSGVATTFATILASRFFCAFFGAVMISNSPGTVVDLSNPDYLAFTLSMWSIAPMNAPSTGGIIGGFIFQYLGWRWSNWIILIGGASTIAMMATCRETYAPTILKRKAARLRRETADPRWWCQYDQKASTLSLVKTNLARPFILAAKEPILWFMNLWISLVYGVLYLCFVAYPIVFSQHRGWQAGLSGLAFVGIGIGTLVSIFSEPLLRRMINRQPKEPHTGKPAPEATALVMAIGSVLTSVGQLAFSWTCLPTSIHWAVPIFFGVPFGIGNGLTFIYGANYIAGAYGIFSASALSSNAVIRSIFGGTLPLAGPRMYEVLTPRWAGTLLGLLEAAMIPIPFVFWRYGAKIRARSRVIRQLRDEQERLDAKRARYQARLRREAEEEVSSVREKDDENEETATTGATGSP